MGQIVRLTWLARQPASLPFLGSRLLSQGEAETTDAAGEGGEGEKAHFGRLTGAQRHKFESPTGPSCSVGTFVVVHPFFFLLQYFLHRHASSCSVKTKRK